MNFFKIALIAIFAIIIQLPAFAQETPAGRAAAATFWKAIEGNRPVQAKSSLDSLKQREPNFDVSKMEKALTELTEKRDSARAAGRNETRAKIAAGQTLDRIFAGVPRSTSFDDAGDVDAAIAENAKMRDQILTMDRSVIQRDLDSALTGLKGSLAYNERKNAGLLQGIKESTDAGFSRRKYNELVFRQSYWENAAKIFPDEADFAAAEKAIADAIKGLGTLDQMSASAEKNRNAVIDAERLPKAAVSDAKLEKWFKDIFITTSQARGKNYTLLKVLITGTDYQVKRNELTGIILGRTRGAAIAFKEADGKCKWGRYAMMQDYAGAGNYTGGTLSMDFDLKEIRCENVK
jgi:hypothetical protein